MDEFAVHLQGIGMGREGCKRQIPAAGLDRIVHAVVIGELPQLVRDHRGAIPLRAEHRRVHHRHRSAADEHRLRPLQRRRDVRRVMQRAVEHDEVELTRRQRQRVKIGPHRHDGGWIVANRAESVDRVVKCIDGNNPVSQRREPVRQPAAAGPEIQNRARLRPRSEHVTQQVTVGLAADAPVARVRIIGLHRRQVAVVAARIGAPPFPLADEAILTQERVEPRPPAVDEEIPDPVLLCVASIAGATHRLHRHSALQHLAALGAREPWQPRDHRRRSAITK